jgi:hypothetical protein
MRLGDIAQSLATLNEQVKNNIVLAQNPGLPDDVRREWLMQSRYMLRTMLSLIDELDRKEP